MVIASEGRHIHHNSFRELISITWRKYLYGEASVPEENRGNAYCCGGMRLRKIERKGCQENQSLPGLWWDSPTRPLSSVKLPNSQSPGCEGLLVKPREGTGLCSLNASGRASGHVQIRGRGAGPGDTPVGACEFKALARLSTGVWVKLHPISEGLGCHLRCK